MIIRLDSFPTMDDLLSMTDLPRRRRKPEPWHNADIVAAVRKAGTNLRQLSLQSGFAASTFRAALHKPHPRANRIIARVIGREVHEIWPQWFTATGARKPFISVSKSRGHSAPAAPAESSHAAADISRRKAA